MCTQASETIYLESLCMFMHLCMTHISSVHVHCTNQRVFLYGMSVTLWDVTCPVNGVNATLLGLALWLGENGGCVGMVEHGRGYWGRPQVG